MFNRFFEGHATFNVEECDYLILNRLRTYSVRNVCITEGGLKFTVPLRFASKVSEILARNKYTVVFNKNVFGLLNIFYSRIAFSIAVIVFLTAFIFLSTLVFSVKVVGVEGEKQSEIAAFVESLGARPLAGKSRDMAEKIAGEIVGQFDYVAHASSKIVGNTLFFNVYCISTAVQGKEGTDIIASSDGVITNIVVASGRPMVKIGDVVRAGQVLIKGERQIGAIDVGRDEYGKLIQEGIFTPCRAVGEVMADVKYSEYGINTTTDDLLAKIIVKAGTATFDKVESFSSGPGVLEVVATVNKSIV